MWKLNIKVDSGCYFCHRCGAKGSWYDFKKKFGGVEGVALVEVVDRNMILEILMMLVLRNNIRINLDKGRETITGKEMVILVNRRIPKKATFH